MWKYIAKNAETKKICTPDYYNVSLEMTCIYQMTPGVPPNTSVGIHKKTIVRNHIREGD